MIVLFLGVTTGILRSPCTPPPKCCKINKVKFNLTLKEFKEKKEINEIKCIDVYDCNISFIQKDLFSHFTNLENLYLRNLPLEYEAIKNSLPKSNETSLTRLCLENVGLTNSQIVDLLSRLPRRITDLGLKKNKITYFSTDDISNATFHHLEKLDLSYNRNITFVLNKTTPALKLTDLYLSYSNVKWTSLGMLPNLIALYLDGNHFNLSVIDNEQRCFQKLKALDLNNCELTEPLNKESFSFLPNLQSLSLSNVSNVKHFPTFQNTRDLRALNLDDVKYPFYPSPENTGLFVNVQKMKRLRMRTWNLRGWNETQLSVLFGPIKDTLETLGLASTGLTTIPQFTAEMKNLKRLCLSNNNISTWSSISERTNKKLTFLNLSCNLIENINPYFIPQNVQDLELDGNPFLCTCGLMSYKTWVWKKKLYNIMKDWQTKYYCSKPPEWTGRSLSEFRPKKSDCRPFNRYVITALVLCCCMVIVVIGTHIVTNKRRQHELKKHKHGNNETKTLLSSQ